jgi:hypothetical protein
LAAPDEDYYTVLGVKKDASSADIRKAFRQLSLTYHPDRHHDPSDKAKAQTKYQSITRAYEVLSDDSKRKEYDMSISSSRSRPFAQGNGFGAESAFRSFFGHPGFQGFHFDSNYGGSGATGSSSAELRFAIQYPATLETVNMFTSRKGRTVYVVLTFVPSLTSTFKVHSWTRELDALAQSYRSLPHLSIGVLAASRSVVEHLSSRLRLPNVPWIGLVAEGHVLSDGACDFHAVPSVDHLDICLVRYLRERNSLASFRAGDESKIERFISSPPPNVNVHFLVSRHSEASVGEHLVAWANRDSHVLVHVHHSAAPSLYRLLSMKAPQQLLPVLISLPYPYPVVHDYSHASIVHVTGVKHMSELLGSTDALLWELTPSLLQSFNSDRSASRLAIIVSAANRVQKPDISFAQQLRSMLPKSALTVTRISSCHTDLAPLLVELGIDPFCGSSDASPVAIIFEGSSKYLIVNSSRKTSRKLEWQYVKKQHPLDKLPPNFPERDSLFQRLAQLALYLTSSLWSTIYAVIYWLLSQPTAQWILSHLVSTVASMQFWVYAIILYAIVKLVYVP